MAPRKHDPATSSGARAPAWRPLVAGVLVSFLAHATWEITQMPLYVVRDPTGLVPALIHCGLTAAGGDLVLMGVLYLVLALALRSWRWPLEQASYTHPATWVLAPAVGALLAVAFELWAVHVDHRWAYAPSMPLVPVLSVGLTPVLQMVLVPLLVLACLRPRARYGTLRARAACRDHASQEVDMPGTEANAKAGCCGSSCSCKDTPIEKNGKRFCSTECAEGHTASCPCGHSDCKPK